MFSLQTPLKITSFYKHLSKNNVLKQEVSCNFFSLSNKDKKVLAAKNSDSVALSMSVKATNWIYL